MSEEHYENLLYYGVEREETPGAAPTKSQRSENGPGFSIAVVLAGLTIMFSPVYFTWIAGFGPLASLTGVVGFIIMQLGILGSGIDASKRQLR